MIPFGLSGGIHSTWTLEALTALTDSDNTDPGSI